MKMAVFAVALGLLLVPNAFSASEGAAARKPAASKAVSKVKSKPKANAKAKVKNKARPGKPTTKPRSPVAQQAAPIAKATPLKIPDLDPDLHLPASDAAIEKEINALREKQRQDPANRDTPRRLALAAVKLTERLMLAQALGGTARAEAIGAFLDTNLPDVGPGVQELAAKGDAKAQQALGYLHARGIAVQADSAKACAAFKRAADSLPGAAWHWAQCVIDSSPDEAWKSMERAALLGHATAQEWMGRRCLGELGASGKDFECARGWLGQSAAQGRSRSQTLLAYLMNAGLGGPVDSSRALRLYSLAAEQGDVDAQNNLGEIHEAGRGVSRSSEAALRWYELAAERGLPAAQFNAGRLLAVGVGDRADPARARALLVHAEAKGVAQSRQVLDWLDRQEMLKAGGAAAPKSEQAASGPEGSR